MILHPEADRLIHRLIRNDERPVTDVRVGSLNDLEAIHHSRVAELKGESAVFTLIAAFQTDRDDVFAEACRLARVAARHALAAADRKHTPRG